MVGAFRRLVGIWALGALAVNLYLSYQVGWPWPLTVALSVVLAGLAFASGILRPAWSRWALAGVALFVGMLGPWILDGRPGQGLIFAASILLEVFLGAWIWTAIRGRFIPRDGLEIRLGRTGFLGAAAMIASEDRFLHVHVLGPTGSGKTEGVLWPMICQDLERPVGVTVLDPKGDLAERTVEAARSYGRTVVAIGPDRPQTLNPLAGEAKAAAQSLVEALDKVFPSDHAFFRTLGRTLLRQSVLALKGVPGTDPGLADLRAFLGDEDVRRQALVQTKDADAKAYFRGEYAGWSAKARNEYTLGLRSALQALADQADIARIMGGKDPLDVDGILERGDVLAVALPTGPLGEAGRIFGSYLLARLQAAAVARKGGAPHFLYVDEFQEFATPSFAEFLELARSYRVGAVLAHQNLAQLPATLRSSVLSNARNRLLLGGLSGEDLETLRDSLGRRVGMRVTEGPDGSVRSRTLIEEPRFAPDFVRRLPRGRAVAQLTLRGQILEPALVRLPHPGRP